MSEINDVENFTDAHGKKHHFQFYSGSDSLGGDAYRRPDLIGNINELKKVCEKDPSCKGFSTNGYFKINEDKLQFEADKNILEKLGKPEDIIDKNQHILSLLIPEVFRHSQSSKPNTQPSTWGFIHLPKNHCGFIKNAVPSQL